MSTRRLLRQHRALFTHGTYDGVLSMSRSSKNRKVPFQNLRRRLNVEALEDRVVPTVNIISGYVYWDQNSDGLYNTGEQPIANSQIQLQELNGNVVAQTTTN